MFRVHKIKLDPTAQQQAYFARACGTARFAYNWALAEWKRQYEAGGKPNEMALRRQLNAIKPTQFPWMLEVTKCAPQQAIKNAGTAFKNFFRNLKTGKTGKKPGYPRFKKKGIRDSFRADNGPASAGADALEVDGKRVKLPIIGWVRMRECVRFAGQNTQATVSRLADGWYLSILVNTDTVLPRKNHGGVLGVDLGVKALAVLSSGDTIAGPKALRVLMPRLQRLSRAVSRKVKGSANRKKAVMRLGRLHKRITDVRSDGLHKLTTRLATEYDVIGIEDLHVAGMLKNRCLARAVSDQGWGEFRRQLDYKAAMTGAQVVVVDRWFPSTKTCSGCGALHDMSLSKRRMSCACGLELDRDLNAAINIATLAASLAVTACGAKGADGGCKTAVKPFAMKQEELHEISA